MSDQTVEISLETVEDLKRIYVQQFKHLMDAQASGNGPKAGQMIRELLESHRSGCATMLDSMAYLITTCDRQGTDLAAANARIAELTAALTLAERALQAEQEKCDHILSCEACQADDGWCPDALGHQIHADELRLAILAAAATPPAAAGGW